MLMSDKDLLAVAVMSIPTLILIAAIAFALGASSKEKADSGSDVSMHAKSQIATQKRMRDPWEKPVYAKTSSAPRAPQCDPEKIEQDGRCLYW